jgi:hypothetical protein
LIPHCDAHFERRNTEFGTFLQKLWEMKENCTKCQYNSTDLIGGKINRREVLTETNILQKEKIGKTIFLYILMILPFSYGT